jgi:hypothetical protein
MDYVTAEQIAAEFGLTGLQLRNALRAANLAWRAQYTEGTNTRWRVPAVGPEREDMVRIAKATAAKRNGHA